jgi:hypothetical protein
MLRTRLTFASAAIALGIAMVAFSAPHPSASAATNTQKKKTASKKAVNPNAPEVVAPGDIPDNQLFVPYRPTSGKYTINVPEGWARTENNGAVTFTDKYNTITVNTGPATEPPTIDSVRTAALADVTQDPTYKAGKVTVFKTPSGTAIKATYAIGSAPNSVTGKKALLAVERYVYFGNGTQVVVTLSGAKGADNVDPWKTVTDSVRVG